MISKTYLYYPGYSTPQERVDWVKNALVNHCGMSVAVNTRLVTDDSTEYYCVVGNTSKGKIWIESRSGSVRFYLAYDDGEKAVLGSYSYVDAEFGDTARRVVIRSKNGIHLFGSDILLNIKAKEIYGANIFYTNALLYIGYYHDNWHNDYYYNRIPFIGYYGEVNCEIVELFSYLGLGGSDLYLTTRYNDLRYYVPSLFIVGHDFPVGAEFASADGDNVSIYSSGSCSMCVCMDHIL